MNSRVSVLSALCLACSAPAFTDDSIPTKISAASA
ncbi:MAG: hypothetical protein HW374_1105, partial [Bacteroidetes bacterium]|nr:hypothetical protein [Bacteroidota bacterium]